MKIEEIKSYKCSDGEVFNTKVEAEEHEKELNNPEYKTEKRIKELERKILELKAENASLFARISELEARTFRKEYWPDTSYPHLKQIAQPGDIKIN